MSEASGTASELAQSGGSDPSQEPGAEARQEAERDRQEAERDRQEAERDRQEAERDRQEAERDRQALQRAAEAGIHRLSIPTPFQVGRVNAYLIEDDPLTLVDSGPNSGKAFDEIDQTMRALGHRIEDIGLLVITHQHMDHFGLASVLARRSGADIAALRALGPYLSSFGEHASRDDAFAQRIMLRHGITPDVAAALRAVSASFRGWGAKVDVSRPLDDGQELRLRDRSLKVHHRPGHSPSDTIFLDQDSGILIGADHLIKHISSNPLIALPLGAGADYDGPRPKSLLTYMQSLRQTREMDVDVVLAGHGEPVHDHRALIDERFRMHARRAEKIRKLIESRPRTAHEVALELWGNVAVTQAYLTLSEVLGHVDLLMADGKVLEEERDGVVRFSAA